MTIPGETGESLTLENVSVDQRGTQYRAVFVNTIGEVATEPAALAVNAQRPAPLEESDWKQFVPESTDALLTQPAGELQGQQTGTTVTISNIPVADGEWVEIFGFSAPVYLGSHFVNLGSTTVSVAGFAPGEHHLAVYDSSNTLLGYVGFVIAADGSGSVVDTPSGAQVLSTTGAAPMAPLAVGAGLILLLGAGAIALAARRRRVGAE